MGKVLETCRIPGGAVTVHRSLSTFKELNRDGCSDQELTGRAAIVTGAGAGIGAGIAAMLPKPAPP